MNIVKKTFLGFFLVIVLFGNLFAQPNLEFLDYELGKKEKRSLIKSMDLFTKKIQSKEWSEVYDLISERLKANWDSKEEFIQWQTEDEGYRFINFKPRKNSLLVLNNEKMRERVQITGCLSVIDINEKHKYWGSLEAERNGTEKWLFSSLPVVNPGRGFGGPRPC